MRLAAVVGLLICCVVGISIAMWKQELKYTLPTPVPADYKTVAVGAPVSLPEGYASDAYFFHFYNPDCPCSRFNARHVQSLLRSYEGKVNFVIVVPSDESLKAAKGKFGSDLMYTVDHNKALARSCGVYSTPQAAIVDSHQKLYFRGNYNKARFCTTRATNFAELALTALLNNQPSPEFSVLAMQSYGCELTDADENESEIF